ncbi:MAG TPA: hypothetical protein ENN49_08920 [Bacteroidales bacterium]|nr:hypothetical protein [Bacteroidales bacterium]
MINIYAVLNKNVDSKFRNKASHKDAEVFNVKVQSEIEWYLTDYLSKLERVTPSAPEKQFYQLLAKIKE